MDSSRVYAKTRDGEEAVQQRTRLVQRNLRNVLIVVDGKSTVAELVRTVGSEQLVTDALSQLEKDGYITVVAGVAKKTASVVEDVSIAGETEEPVARVEPVFPGAAVERVSPPFPDLAATESKSPFGPPSSSSFPSPQPDDVVGPMSAPPSISPFQTPASSNPFVIPGGAAQKAPPVSSSFGQEAKTAGKQAGASSALESDPIADVSIKPIRRGRRKVLTPQRVIVSIAAVFSFIFLGILFFPYSYFHPEIEAALSEAFGQPVNIGEVSARFSPAPTLVFSKVSVGQGTGITVDEVAAYPGPAFLFANRRSFGRVFISGANVPMEQLGVFVSTLGAASKASAFSVSDVTFSRTTLRLRDIVFQNYSGAAELFSNGQLKRLALKSLDGTLKISVDTDAGVTGVMIEGSDWKSGEKSPYVFDSLSIVGELSGSRFIARKVDGRIFNGILQGQFEFDWTSGMSVDGDVSIDYMTSELLAKAMGSGSLTLDGQISARVRFASGGPTWATLVSKIPLEGSFIARKGGVNGMDIVEAVRRTSQLAMRGGTTKFDELTGDFRWDAGVLQLNNLSLDSGMLQATGFAGVLNNGQVTGTLNVLLKGSATTVRVPVTLTGTLVDPQLFGGRR